MKTRRWVWVALALCAMGAPLEGAVCPVGTAGKVWTDAALGHPWQALADCGHPERPWKLRNPPLDPPLAASSHLRPGALLGTVRGAVPATASGVSVRLQPVVRPGSPVTLWEQTSESRIELAGTAIDGGGAGDAVNVHVMGEARQLRGVVRGPGSVEITGLAGPLWGRP